MKDKHMQRRSACGASVVGNSHSLSGDVWSDWRRLGKADPTVLKDLAAMFERDCDQCLAVMAASWSEGNKAECSRVAHILVGSCRQIGADGMSNLCLEIKRAIQNDDQLSVSRLLRRIRSEYLQVQREIEDAAAKDGVDS